MGPLTKGRYWEIIAVPTFASKRRRWQTTSSGSLANEPPFEHGDPEDGDLVEVRCRVDSRTTSATRFAR